MNKDLQDSWKWVKLGDIAFEVSDRIDNPSKSGLERFVGLEHLDSESLTVKRWGSTDDVTSAMKLFKKGDILFARRNAYLKRASMATFDGVCSGDAIVLRQKKEDVNGLLPLILNTEKLWEFAIANASGSMSKRVKWRDLATFEVPLAPKDEQRRIADILWAAEDYIVKNEKLADETELYKKVLLKELLTKGIDHREINETEIGKIPGKWERVKLGDITDDFVGGGTPSTSNITYWNGKIAWMTSAHINGRLVISGQRYITEKGLKESPTHLVPKGNLLVATRVGIGKVAINLIDVAISQDLTGVILKKDKASVDFVYWSLISNSNRLNSMAQGSTIKGVLKEDLLNLELALPPLPEQNKIAEILSKLDDVIQEVQKNINKTEELKKMLLNKFLNGGLETAVSIIPQSKRVIYETQVSE